MNVAFRWFLVAATFSAIIHGENATSTDGHFQVVSVMGGGAVVNGSTPLVVLNCHYIIPSGEEAGLVVKWYHGTNPRPVYQWIYGSLPQALGILKNRLDLQYKSSPDELRSHSALAFLAPTTELAGLYTCRVATYFDEDLASTTLLIYNPASQFTFRQLQQSLDMTVLICSASGLYPKPEMSLTGTDLSIGKPITIDASVRLQWDSVIVNYRITATFEVAVQRLSGPTEFVCRLTLPGTEYRLEKRTQLRPAPQQMPSASASAASVRSAGQQSTGNYFMIVLLLYSLMLFESQTEF